MDFPLDPALGGRPQASTSGRRYSDSEEEPQVFESDLSGSEFELPGGEEDDDEPVDGDMDLDEEDEEDLQQYSGKGKAHAFGGDFEVSPALRLYCAKLTVRI